MFNDSTSETKEGQISIFERDPRLSLPYREKPSSNKGLYDINLHFGPQKLTLANAFLIHINFHGCANSCTKFFFLHTLWSRLLMACCGVEPKMAHVWMECPLPLCLQIYSNILKKDQKTWVILLRTQSSSILCLAGGLVRPHGRLIFR